MRNNKRRKPVTGLSFLHIDNKAVYVDIKKRANHKIPLFLLPLKVICGIILKTVYKRGKK